MEIMIRATFESIEKAEQCIRKIKEAGIAASEITLSSDKKYGWDNTSVFIAPSAGAFSNVSPGGTFVIGARLNDDVGGQEYLGADNGVEQATEATMEILADSAAERMLRQIIINGGGRGTVVM